MLTCTRLRTAVFLSALLLVLGLALEVIAGTTPWFVAITYLALFIVLFGAILLASVFLVSLFPGTARRLSECQH